MPSYLGSKVQSLPSGMSVPTEASIGSSAPSPSAFAEAARAEADGAAVFLGELFAAACSRASVLVARDFGSRLECHTRPRLFSAISSIVRPVATEVVSFGDDVGAGLGVLIAMLDEEPLRLVLGAAPRAHEHPRAVHALAVHHDLEIAFLVAAPQRGIGITLVHCGCVRAAIPEHDRAAAVLALRDRSLEGVVVDRVILDLHREPLDGRIVARALGHGPALHHAVELEAEVEVEMTRRVLLDDEDELPALASRAPRCRMAPRFSRSRASAGTRRAGAEPVSLRAWPSWRPLRRFPPHAFGAF